MIYLERVLLIVRQILQSAVNAARSDMHRFSYQLKLSLKECIPPQPMPKPLFVLATFRSGSNFLISHLKCLPDIYCIGSDSEVLRADKYATFYTMKSSLDTTQSALRHIKRVINASPRPYAGIKLMLSHLTRYQITPEVLLRVFAKAKIIVLYRRSLIEQYVSLQKVNTHQVFTWTQGKNTTKETKVHINPELFIKYCHGIKAQYNIYLNHPLMQNKFFLLCYEDFIKNEQEIIKKDVAPYLHITSKATHTKLKKQAILPIQEIISNYSEVESLIKSDIATQNYHHPSGN